jgi:hypothetical protein
VRPSFLTDRLQAKPGPPPKEELKGGLKELMEKSLEPDEKVHAIVEGGMGEAIVATNRRVLALKCGFMAGAYKEPICFSFDYEEIYVFEWGKRRRLIEIIPYDDLKKRKVVVTFLPFQDRAFTNTVSFMAQKVVETRKKNPEIDKKAKKQAMEEALRNR